MQAVRQLEGATGSGPCKLHIRNLHVAMSVRLGLQAPQRLPEHRTKPAGSLPSVSYVSTYTTAGM